MLALLSHSHWVNAVDITPDGRRALSGSYDRTLKLWDLHSWRSHPFLRRAHGFDSRGGRGPDDRHALSGSGTARCGSGTCQPASSCIPSPGTTGPVSAVAICPDGRHALSGSDDRTLRLWNIEERICRAKITLDSSPLAIAWHRTARPSWSAIELATSITSNSFLTSSPCAGPIQRRSADDVLARSVSLQRQLS